MLSRRQINTIYLSFKLAEILDLLQRMEDYLPYYNKLKIM